MTNMILTGKVIRMCSSKDCNAIYLDGNQNLTYIKPCKRCDNGTGFFENLDHFYRHIDLYGIDTDNILDASLRKEVCNHYGIEE